MEGLSLGGLILELGLNLETYEADLQLAKERAIATAKEIEKSFERSLTLDTQAKDLRSRLKNEFNKSNFKIQVDVDSKALITLNRQLSVTKRHIADISNHLDSGTLKIKVDDTDVDAATKKTKRARQEYQELRRESRRSAETKNLSIIKIDAPNVGQVLKPLTSVLKQVNNLVLAPFRGIEAIAKAILNPILSIFSSVEKSSRKITAIQEKASQKLKLTTVVDDRALYSLNKHLDVKKKHFDEVNRHFKITPLKPRVDLSELDALSRRLDDLEGRSQRATSAKTRAESTKTVETIVTQSSSSKTSNDTASQITSDVDKAFERTGGKLADSIGKSIKRAMPKVGIGSILSGLFKATIGNIFQGSLEGLGRELTSGLTKGLSGSLEKTLSYSVGSSRLFGEKVGDSLVKGLEDQLKRLDDLPQILDEKIEQISDQKLRRRLKEQLEAFEDFRRQFQENSAAMLKDVMGPEEDAIAEGLAQRRRSQAQKKTIQQSAREQGLEEWRQSRREVADVQSVIPSQIQALDKEIVATAQQFKKSRDSLAKIQKTVETVFSERIQASKQKSNEAEAEKTGEVTKATTKFDAGNDFLAKAVPFVDRRRRLMLEQAVSDREYARKTSEIQARSEAIPRLQTQLEAAKASGNQSKVDEITEQIEDTQKTIQVYQESVEELNQHRGELQGELSKLMDEISQSFGGHYAAEVLELAEEMSEVQSALTQSATALQALQSQRQALEQSDRQAQSKLGESFGRFEAIKQKELPKAYVEMARVAFGDKFDLEKLPKLIIDDAKLKKEGAVALYNNVQNSIRVTAEMMKAIEEGTLSQRQRFTLFEELYHGEDFDFGSYKGYVAKQENRPLAPVEPTGEELMLITPELGFYSEEVRGVELNAKTKALRANRRFAQKQEDTQKLNQISEMAQFAVSAGNAEKHLKNTVAELERLAQETGKDVTASVETITEVFTHVIESFKSLSRDLLSQLKEGGLDAVDLTALEPKSVNAKAAYAQYQKLVPIAQGKVKKLQEEAAIAGDFGFGKAAAPRPVLRLEPLDEDRIMAEGYAVRNPVRPKTFGQIEAAAGRVDDRFIDTDFDPWTGEAIKSKAHRYERIDGKFQVSRVVQTQEKTQPIIDAVQKRLNQSQVEIDRMLQEIAGRKETEGLAKIRAALERERSQIAKIAASLQSSQSQLNTLTPESVDSESQAIATAADSLISRAQKVRDVIEIAANILPGELEKAPGELAVAPPQPAQPKTNRQKLRDAANTAGIVARGAVDGAGAIAFGVTQATNATVNTLKAVNKNLQSIARSPAGQALIRGMSDTAFAFGVVARAAYKVAEGTESIVLDLVPLGRTIKGVTQQVVLPAAAFGAATHFLPGGQIAAHALTDMASSAIAPFAQGAAGSATGAASQFISHAVPNVFGIQGAITTAVSGAIESAATIATSAAAQAGAAVLGGKAIQAAVTLPAKGAIAGAKALAPTESKALPPAASQALPPTQEEFKLPIKESQQAELVPVDAIAPVPPRSQSAPPPVKVEPPRPTKLDSKSTKKKDKSSTPQTIDVTPSTESGQIVTKSAAELRNKATAKPEFRNTAEAIGHKAGQAVGAAKDAIQSITRNPKELAEEAIAKAKELDANFAKAYQTLLKAIEDQDNERVQIWKDTILKLAEQGKADLDSTLKAVKDAGGNTGFGSEVSQFLGSVKGRLTSKTKTVQRNVSKYERLRKARGDDGDLASFDVDAELEALKRDMGMGGSASSSYGTTASNSARSSYGLGIDDELEALRQQMNVAQNPPPPPKPPEPPRYQAPPQQPPRTPSAARDNFTGTTIDISATTSAYSSVEDEMEALKQQMGMNQGSSPRPQVPTPSEPPRYQPPSQDLPRSPSPPSVNTISYGSIDDELEALRGQTGQRSPSSAAKPKSPVPPSVEQLDPQHVIATIAQAVAKASGVTVKPGQIPKLVVDNRFGQKGGPGGAYQPASNSIFVSPDTYKILQGSLAELAKAPNVFQVLVHEMRHALQYDFGRLKPQNIAYGAQPGVAMTSFDQASHFAQEAATAAAIKAAATIRQIMIEEGASAEDIDRLLSKHENATRSVEVDAYEFQKQQTIPVMQSVIEQLGGSGNNPAMGDDYDLASLNIDAIAQSPLVKNITEQASQALNQLRAIQLATIDQLKEMIAEWAEIKPEATLRETVAAAAISPKGKATAKDLLVNTAGFAASKAAQQYGVVPELSADLIAALAMRQAMSKVMPGDQNEELFGDLTGWAVGNFAANLPGMLGDTALGALSPIPLKGAGVAMAAVPRLAKLRDRMLSSTQENAAMGDDQDLASLKGDGNKRLRKKITEGIARFLNKEIKAIDTYLEGGDQVKANDQVIKTMNKLNKMFERVIKNRGDIVDEAFHAELRAITQQTEDMAKYFSDRVASLPDIEQLMEEAIANRTSAQFQVAINENEGIIRDNDQRIAKNFEEGISDEFAPIYLEQGLPAPTGLMGGIKSTFKGIQADYVKNLSKRSSLLAVQAQGLEGEVESDRLMAAAQGDTDKADKLGKIGSRTSKARAGIEEILAKPKIEGDDVSKLQRYSNELDKVFKMLNRPVPPDPGGFGAIAGKMNGLMTILRPLTGAIASFASLAVMGNLMKDFTRQSLQAALSLDKLSTAMTFASGSSAKAGSDLGYVEKVASDLKIPLGAAREGFVKLTASTRGTKVEGQATRDLFLGVSQAATVLGLSAEDTNGILLAFSQIASKGKVQAEELRSQVGERLPGAFSMAARAMGVTEAELNKMMELGQVTAEDFLPKMARQLQSELGGAAVNASKDAQSAIYDFGNSVQKVQEGFGKAIQPAQIAGFRLATEAIEFLADKGDELGKIFILVSTVLAGRLVAGLMQAAAAFAQTAIASQLASLASQGFAKGMWAATASIRAFMLQMALVYGAMEAGRVLFETFVPTGLSAEFSDFADQAENGLKRIEDAARRARGEIEKIPPGGKGSAGSREGTDEGLESKGINFGLFKSDDAVKLARSLPGIKQVSGFIENATGGAYTPFTTQAEHQFGMALEQATRAETAASAIAGQAFNSAGLASQIAEVQSVDAELKALQEQRQVLSKQGKLDKNQLKVLSEQETQLQAKRDAKADPIKELQSQIGSQLQGARAQIEAIENTKGMSPENAARLKAPYENMVANLEKAEKNLNRLQNQAGKAIDPARQLAMVFEKVAIALESAQETTEKIFQGRTLRTNQEQLAGWSTNIGAARDAAVSRAENERDRLKQTVMDTQVALNAQSEAINDPNAQTLLKGLTVDGEKPITVDSTFAEIESAKKRLTDKDAAKKDVLDRLKAFKEAQKAMREAEVQLSQAELGVKESEASRTTQDFQENFQLRDSQIQRQTNKELAIAKRGLRDRKVTEEQGAVDLAKIQEGLTNKQIREAEFQLKTWRDARDAGIISAEQFAQKELEITDKISGLQLQAEENTTARIEAERRKRLTNLEQANKKTEAAIALSQTVASAAIKSDTMAGLAPEDAAIAQTDVQQTANAAKVAQIKREIEQTKALQADGTISAKEATEKQIQLQQQLADANAQAVDLQIQKQEQLRAAIERSFQRRREQLKLEQTAAENELQAGAIAAMRSGPIDTRALELSTQGQSLGLRAGAIANEIALLQQEMAELDALGLKDQDTADKRRALSQQMLDLERDRISNIKELDQNAREQEIHGLEQRAAAQKRASEAAIANLEREKAMNDLLSQSIEMQSKLMESRNNLMRASSELGLAQSNAQLKRLERAQTLQQKANDKNASPRVRQEAQRQMRRLGISPSGDELTVLKKRQALEDDIAQKRLAALEMEQSFQRQSLEIDLKRQRIAIQNLAFEAEIAKMRAKSEQEDAQSNLESAIASGDSTKIADAQSRLKRADREVELSDLKLGYAQQSLGMQDQLESDSRNLLTLKQQTERVNFNSEMEGRESDRDLARAEAGRNGNRRSWKSVRAGRPNPRSKAPVIRANEIPIPQTPQAIAPQVPQLNPMAIAPGVANFVPPTMPKMAAMPDYAGNMVSSSVVAMSSEVCSRLDKMIDRLTAMSDRPTVGQLVYNPQSGETAGSVVTDLTRAGARGAGL